MKDLSLFILCVFSTAFFSCTYSNKSDCCKNDSLNIRITLEVIGGNDAPVLKKGDAGTEDNKYGFEGGTVIKLNDGYHLFSAEMVGEPRWVKMKLGHWLSADGKQWKRIGTLRESSGDFTGRDFKAATWSPMPVFNENENRWNLFYVGYRSQPDSGGLWLSNYEGRIYRAVSETEGKDGINGPYKDVNLVMEPGKESDSWEGLQGTDSFFPYLAADGKYHGFYGSAQTQKKHITFWQVGLASSETLEGNWKRCSNLNPVDLGISFTENPVVTKLDNGLYVAVVDAGYDSTGLCRSAFGYFYSKDGIHWSKEQLCYFENKIPKWWKMMRTPLCLIKEDDGTFTVFHTAYAKDDFGSVGMMKIKLTIDTLKPIVYKDTRSVATLRMEANDVGVVLHYGDGPDSCDYLGAREAIINRDDSTYYLFYDGAGPKGWLACLATSKDLIHWEKKGNILDFGKPGENDHATATSPWVYKEGKQWHMFYVASPNATPAPDYIPAFPYLTLKAVSNSLAGPWIKQKKIIPFEVKPETYYSSTASPGFIVKQNNEFMQFFSASTCDSLGIRRTLSIARTNNIAGNWKIDDDPIVPLDEQVENSSLYFEETNQTWFLFTNHIGYDKDGEYTDAIWVYWSKDLNKWDANHKAIVLDGQNCKWSHRCIGLPSVIKYKNRLAVLYDAPGDNSVSHMRRSIGLAFLNLPLNPPK